MACVLLVEDDSGERRLIERLLGDSHALTWCADRQTALGQLVSGQHDVWLIDYHLPGCDGLDLLAIARQSDPFTGAILISSATDPAVDRRAAELGASARLDKQGLTAEALQRAIVFAVQRRQMLTGLTRQIADGGPDAAIRLERMAHVERALRRARVFEGINLDRGLFLERLLTAGLALASAHAGAWCSVAHGCVQVEVCTGLDDVADSLPDRPFVPAVDTLVGLALADGDRLLIADVARDVGLGDWQPGSVALIPVTVDAQVAGLVLLGGSDLTLPHELDLACYAELCASAVERLRADVRRRQAAELLEQGDRLLRAVSGLAGRLAGLDDRARALWLAAESIGRASDAVRVLVVESVESGAACLHTQWVSPAGETPDALGDPPDALERTMSRVALALQDCNGSPWPRAVPTLPGHPSLVVVPLPAILSVGDAPCWGAIVIIGSRLDVRTGPARSILRSAARLLIPPHAASVSPAAEPEEPTPPVEPPVDPRIPAPVPDAACFEGIDRLAGAVSHAVNNLLTVVITSAAIAGDTLDPAHPARPDLVEITEAGEAGARLARQLLQMTGAHAATLRPVDPADVMRHARRLWRAALPTGLQPQVDLPEGIASMQADVHQMVQVMLLLVVNARDAVDPDGQISVTAREERLSVREQGLGEPRAFVVLSVIDDGRGMPAAVRDRAFHPFFTTRQNVRGAGLGLATVYGIVRRHNGRILLGSSPGRGTTVEIWIPAAVDDSSA